MIILENLDVSRVPGVLLGTHLNINLEFSALSRPTSGRCSVFPGGVVGDFIKIIGNYYIVNDIIIRTDFLKFYVYMK